MKTFTFILKTILNWDFKRNLCLLITFLFFLTKTHAQTDPYPYRGLYVDKFLKVSNPSSTILGQTSKEDSLLNYARDNDFKYLILYDVEGVLDNLNTHFPTDTSKTYSEVFCDFIHKAKTQYCVEHIGVSLSAANYFDIVGVTMKGNFKILVNTANILQGMYFYRFLVNNVEMDRGKLVIVK